MKAVCLYNREVIIIRKQDSIHTHRHMENMNETSTATSRNQRKHANRKAKRDEKLRSDLPRVESWLFAQDEYGDQVLVGNVYNHRSREDGASIQTSPLVSCGHLFAVTLSGSKYLLGTPSKKYIDFREKHGLGPISQKVFHFDP